MEKVNRFPYYSPAALTITDIWAVCVHVKVVRKYVTMPKTSYFGDDSWMKLLTTKHTKYTKKEGECEFHAGIIQFSSFFLEFSCGSCISWSILGVC
jgi:hypothetical protein